MISSVFRGLGKDYALHVLKDIENDKKWVEAWIKAVLKSNPNKEKLLTVPT